MVVDVSTVTMSIGEAAIETMRKIDAIVYEAQMGIMMEEYTYLQENGVSMEAEEKVGIVQRVKDAISKMVDTLLNLLITAKQNIDKKVKEIKQNHEAKVAARKIVKELDDIYDEVKKDAEESKKKADKTTDTSVLSNILNKFKETCNDAADSIKKKTKTVKIDILDSNGKKIATTKGKVEVSG